jgi:hypothetical protein
VRVFSFKQILNAKIGERGGACTQRMLKINGMRASGA